MCSLVLFLLYAFIVTGRKKKVKSFFQKKQKKHSFKKERILKEKKKERKRNAHRHTLALARIAYVYARLTCVFTRIFTKNKKTPRGFLLFAKGNNVFVRIISKMKGHTDAWFVFCTMFVQQSVVFVKQRLIALRVLIVDVL